MFDFLLTPYLNANKIVIRSSLCNFCEVKKQVENLNLTFRKTKMHVPDFSKKKTKNNFFVIFELNDK